MSSLIDGILESLHPLVDRYEHWTVVVTSDPNQARSGLGPLAAWHQWDAKHESVARVIQEYLCARGVKTMVNTEHGGTHVCIFRPGDAQLAHMSGEPGQI
jgi:hypothetical protein